jgi:redox-sensitive bicupin YhaK (pirin superfamily)
MVQVRRVRQVFLAKETIEGAGVRLHRAFGYNEVPLFDPFLMLDDFRAWDNPDDYMAGFPWHPHRGIETVTYMWEGKVEHGDSMGNSGSVNGGDIQWMTAGSGIIHQEMPKPVDGRMGGFQLWVNLPRSRKMMDPRYQEIKGEEVPVISPSPGVSVKVICGEIHGVKGPVRDIVIDPLYLDVTIGPGNEFTCPVRKGYTAAAYVTKGAGSFEYASGSRVKNRDMLLFGDGDLVSAVSFDSSFRFLLFAGTPLKEPVAWGGPIVMNTQEELRQAFMEFRDGTFIKKK